MSHAPLFSIPPYVILSFFVVIRVVSWIGRRSIFTRRLVQCTDMGRLDVCSLADMMEKADVGSLRARKKKRDDRSKESG